MSKETKLEILDADPADLPDQVRRYLRGDKKQRLIVSIGAILTGADLATETTLAEIGADIDVIEQSTSSIDQKMGHAVTGAAGQLISTDVTSNVVINTEGCSSVTVRLTPGTLAGPTILRVEGTVDGVTWNGLSLWTTPNANGNWNPTQFSAFSVASGVWDFHVLVPCAGFQSVRLRVSTAGAGGTGTANLEASQGNFLGNQTVFGSGGVILQQNGPASSLTVAETVTATGTNATTGSHSVALEGSRVIKASAGRLYEQDVTNGTLGVGGFIHYGNSVTVPADGAVPLKNFTIGVTAAVNGTISRSYPKGIFFSTGISVWASTTPATKTLGAATFWFDHEFT